MNDTVVEFEFADDITWKRSDAANLRAVRETEYAINKGFWLRSLAAALLIAFAPAMGVCMLLVRLTSRGPALFRQTRLGKDGKPFEILKIRTMTVNAESESGAVLCKPSDPRITHVGRALRFLHLDELPQLINVVRGEMCLVGPRPERPEIIVKHDLNNRIPGFALRTRVLPGVTGLAQINLPADQTPDCVVPKVQLDLEYIETASPLLDVRILLCTGFRMFGVRHGRAVRLFGLGRKVSNPAVPAKRRRKAPVKEPVTVGAALEDWSPSFKMSEMSASCVHEGNDVDSASIIRKHPR